MAARDLVAELKNKRASVTSAAAEEPMNTAQIEEMETTAVAHRELDGCWCLNVSAEYQDAAVKSGDMDMVECMQAMTGTAFFDTGNGQPLHRPTEEQMPLACSVYFFAVPTGTWTPGWCCGSHLFWSERDKSRWDNACGLRSLCWAGGQHNVPSSFHFAKKPSKGIEAVRQSYLTQTIACKEQLDESKTEASVFSDEMRERWPNSGEFKPNDQSLSLTLQKMSQSLIQNKINVITLLQNAVESKANNMDIHSLMANNSQLDESMTEADKPIGLKTDADKQLDESMTEADEMSHLRLMSTVSARDSFRC